MRIQNKNFLFGLGTGLVAASLLFGLSDLLSSSKNVVEPATNKQIASSANSLPSAGQSAPQDTKSPPANQQNSVSSAPAQEQGKSPEKVKVEIKEGMTASQIADLLVQNGVVTDQRAFLQAADEKVKQIRIGTYELPVKGDFGQIIQIITSAKPQ